MTIPDPEQQIDQQEGAGIIWLFLGVMLLCIGCGVTVMMLIINQYK